jgi:YYY domain-containing protein
MNRNTAEFETTRPLMGDAGKLSTNITAHVATDIFVTLALVALLIVGAYFRFTGQNWDDYTHLHPDERFLTQVAEAIGGSVLIPTDKDPAEQQRHREECLRRYPETGGVGDFFDAYCSTWNPNNVGYGLYVYGQLPLFTVRATAEIVSSIAATQASATEDPNDDVVARSLTGYNGVHLIGRMVSATAELTSLIFLFLIGRRLFNKWVALLAVAFAVAGVFPIQLSHFWTADAFTNLPVLIAFYFAVRAMDTGKLTDFLGFGVGMGLALASRVNTLPLFGVIVLAAIIHGLPALDPAVFGNTRNRILSRLAFGIIIASIFTGITFRFANPHAFNGAPGIFSVIPVGINAGWSEDVAEARYLTSGRADIPPNHQWASRSPYGFPWWNMVMWGMGLPLGLMCWFGWLWSVVEIVRARPGWTRVLLVAVWIFVYFAFMGRQWVMTMRYFMPLYPFLFLLGAWAFYEMVTRTYRAMRDNPTLFRRFAFAWSVFTLGATAIFTYTYAYGFVDAVYNRLLTRVQASHWFLENVPAAFSTTLAESSGRTHLVNIPITGFVSTESEVLEQGERGIIPFLPSAFGEVDRVIINRLFDPDMGGEKTVNVGISLNAEGSLIITQGRTTGIFRESETGDPLGGTVTVMLDQPVMVNQATNYWLVVWSDDGRLVVSRRLPENTDLTLTNSTGIALAQLRLPNNDPDMSGQASAMFANSPIQGLIRMPVDGTLDSLDITHLISPLRDRAEYTLIVEVLDASSGATLTRGTLRTRLDSTRTSVFGDAYSVPLETPLNVTKDQMIAFSIRAEEGRPLVATGTVIAVEGAWDDPVPQKVCALAPEMDLSDDTPSGLVNVAKCQGVDPWGTLYRGLELEMYYPDEITKREIMIKALNEADYVTFSSNRFYDTLTRLPARFPMSVDFYEAIFSGDLGYDLVQTFTSYPRVFGIELANQHLPHYVTEKNAPAWLNEFEAEEAFHVYDHPAVLVFKRNPDRYNPNATAQILNSTPTNSEEFISYSMGTPDATIVNVVRRWDAFQASASPTALMMTPELRAIQTSGGTYTDLFNPEWMINRNQIAAVVFWWLAMLAFGIAAFPILYVLMPGLPDRGWAFSKIAGLLIVSWIVWAGASIRLATWNQMGILITLIGMAAVSLILIVTRWREFAAFVRLNFRHLIIVETITVILFIVFVFVRLGNPDLWAEVHGGEKPMDFAYFNAILRSTVFPPYDPWYAGGYLNYYYFGFVLVGAPVKLLGLDPAVAYNLIIPALFAMTGIGAFGVAFNLVASRYMVRRESDGESEDAQETDAFLLDDTDQIPPKDAPLKERRRAALRVPLANPYTAGILALLFCAVFGNLDTPRTFFTAIARHGGCAPMDMYTWRVEEFLAANGRGPNAMESSQLVDLAANPSLGDRINYGFFELRRSVTCIGNGLTSVAQGGAIPLNPDRWYWGPRSVVGETLNSTEINEMPFFTFVFADLHAHMIAMPMTLLVIGWLLAEVLAAGRIRRATWIVVVATIFGGIAVGVLRPANTWDWITYLLLGAVGLIFAHYLRRLAFNRASIAQIVSQLALFGAAQWIAAVPFTAFFATSYSSFKSYTGAKTPVWAYFTLHGLFLFIVIAFLVWQTARVLRSVYVRDFIRRAWILQLMTFVIALTLLIAIVLTVLPMPVALISGAIPLAIVLVPLLAWTGILFFLPDQPRQVRTVLAIVGLALSISLGVEIIVLDGDIIRQNTFFKFYLQIWILFSVAGGVALAWLWQASARWRGALRAPWLGFAAILMAISAMYPITATQGKFAMRHPGSNPITLDGLEWMESALLYGQGGEPFLAAGDLDMIRWLRNNVQGTPVIVEAHQYPSEYKWNGRISINTGLPTVLGWQWHQKQQRTLDPLPNYVQHRGANVFAIYDLTDIPRVWDLLRFYHVQYIVVGALERAVYLPEGIAKFDRMVQLGLLELVYQSGEDRIYRVVLTGNVDADVQVGMR